MREQALRLSPFDSWAFAAFGSQTLGHFLLDRPHEAAKAAYLALQSNPAHSINELVDENSERGRSVSPPPETHASPPTSWRYVHCEVA
jgi:hypothetical protein